MKKSFAGPECTTSIRIKKTARMEFVCDQKKNIFIVCNNSLISIPVILLKPSVSLEIDFWMANKKERIMKEKNKRRQKRDEDENMKF